MRPLTFLEFFAGAGMARAGLGPRWECKFANDFDAKKASAYRANWGAKEFLLADIRTLDSCKLPTGIDLVWASFPCQDLSLAGAGAGLQGDRSGTFWPFWNLMKGMVREGSPPRAIVLENVCGTLTSHRGADFVAICQALTQDGYTIGALVVDAAYFVPQSRPRLFIIGVHDSANACLSSISQSEPQGPWFTKQLRAAHGLLRPDIVKRWCWWNLPEPSKRLLGLSQILEREPSGVRWNTDAETSKLLEMMSPLHRLRLESISKSKVRTVGAVYKRTRVENGVKVQRAEVRFDDVSGCLRTPAGGSSRQTIIVVDGHQIRSRLISIRETARLMGLPESYELPSAYNEGYHLTGDGVAVPVVSYIAEQILEPLLRGTGVTNCQRAA